MSAFAIHLFTDVEGSTRLWEQQAERMRPALAEHDAWALAAVNEHGGRVVKTTGDGLHAVFDHATDALAAALQLQQALQAPRDDGGLVLAVRCGLHAGVDEARGQDFYGRHVNRAARIMSAAQGGQVLVSEAIAQALADQLPPDVRLLPLGAVRLRDLPQPEPLYQVLAPGLRAHFAPLQSLAETPHNLPQPLNRFIGRDTALAELRGLLGAHRLVTLWGPGGMGKSRLSIELAHGMLADFPDGVWLVELAPLADAAAVPQALAAVLGVQEAPGQALAAALAAHVRQRRLLLILDNCEHVHAGAAALAKSLLQAGAAVRVLASSRELLHVAGEKAYAVLSLSVPGVGGAPGGASGGASGADAAHIAQSLLRHDAVKLLADRAALVRPGFVVDKANAQAVAQICRRLDGIPLAIELAAARLRAMSPEVLARRLVDSFALVATPDQTVAPRQRTLQVLIDWSWNLLRPPEQALLARLSLFAGGCTLDAAEAVCADAELSADQVLDGLGQLVDKSLLVLDADGQRYSLLDTVRHYADDKRRAFDDTALRERYIAHQADLAEALAADLASGAAADALKRFDQERANLLNSHGLALAHADPAFGLPLAFRLGVALKHYVVHRGLLTTGVQLLRATLNHPALATQGAADAQPDLQPFAVERARALFDLGHLCNCLGQSEDARQALQASLAIVRRLGFAAREAAILQPLGLALAALGRHDEALDCFDKAIAVARQHQLPRQLMTALVLLAQWHVNARQWADAEPIYQQAMALARQHGHADEVATIALNLGMVAICRGDMRAGMACTRVAIAHAGPDRPARLLLAVQDLGCALAMAGGQADTARRLWQASQQLMADTGLRREPADEAFAAPLGLQIAALPASAVPAALPPPAPPDAADLPGLLDRLLTWLDGAAAPQTAGLTSR